MLKTSYFAKVVFPFFSSVCYRKLKSFSFPEKISRPPPPKNGFHCMALVYSTPGKRHEKFAGLRIPITQEEQQAK